MIDMLTTLMMETSPVLRYIFFLSDCAVSSWQSQVMHGQQPAPEKACSHRLATSEAANEFWIPNTAVVHRARCNAASGMLVQRQLLLFGKVLRSPLEEPWHVSAFMPGTLQPASRYVRRVDVNGFLK